MANLNKVMIMGNLTRDPEVKYTTKGTAVAQLGLAINRYLQTDGGEKQEETTFVDVELWGRQAEIAGEYLKKGRPVFIEGRLKLDSWDDKATGQKRTKMKVVGEQLQLIGGREGGGKPEEPDDHTRRQSSRPAAPPKRPPADPDLDAPEDDIPF